MEIHSRYPLLTITNFIIIVNATATTHNAMTEMKSAIKKMSHLYIFLVVGKKLIVYKNNVQAY